jgi:hypothetical protein
MEQCDYLSELPTELKVYFCEYLTMLDIIPMFMISKLFYNLFLKYITDRKDKFLEMKKHEIKIKKIHKKKYKKQEVKKIFKLFHHNFDSLLTIDFEMFAYSEYVIDNEPLHKKIYKFTRYIETHDNKCDCEVKKEYNICKLHCECIGLQINITNQKYSICKIPFSLAANNVGIIDNIHESRGQLSKYMLRTCHYFDIIHEYVIHHKILAIYDTMQLFTENVHI